MLQVVPAAGDLRSLWPIAVGRSRAPGLKGAAAVGVLMALWMHSDFGTARRAWPSAGKLAAFARSDEKTARRALQAAVDAGYIQLVRRGGGRGRTARGNEYALTMPTEEAEELREIAGSKTLAKLSEDSPPVSDDSAETPDNNMSDVSDGSAETPDILKETPDISAGNSGHQDVRQPSPRTFPVEGRAGAGARASRDADGSDPLSELNEEGTGGSAADASDASSVRPAEKCPEHIGMGYVRETCGACGEAGKRAKKWDAEQDARERAAVQAKRDAIKACTRCDEVGWLLGPNGDVLDKAFPCDHGPGADAKLAELKRELEPSPVVPGKREFVRSSRREVVTA